MRRFTQVTAVAVAAAALLLLAPGPASAGGPTSVLLVSPGRHATASLYNTDEAYTRLHAMLGENPQPDPAAPPSLQGGPGSDAINVTWLRHDVQVWRVDRIFTDAKDGPWVETSMVLDGASPFNTPGTRHRANDPKELIALLSALRLLGESPPAAYDGAKAPAVQQQPAPAAAVAQQPPDRGWLWLLLGVAAGVVLVIGFRPLVRRLRPQLASGHG